MLDYNTMGACVLALTLATIFMVIPFTLRAQRSEKGVGIWLLSGLTGVLLGAGGGAAAIQLMGYEVAHRPSPLSSDYFSADEPSEDGGGSDMEEEGDSAAEEEGGDSSMGMGMGMSMGGGGMGMGGGRGPSPKRDLTTLVRKIDLLTGDVALNLSDDQAAGLAEVLVRVNSQETMAEDDAKTAQDEILAILDDTQKAKQEAIGLPRSVGGRGGRGGGPGGDEDANPFAQEENATAIQSLLDRLGAGTSPAAEPQAVEAEEPSEESAEETAEGPAPEESVEESTEEIVPADS